jgi:Fibrobacter succinogenes major domain (Fib_succ_major).
VARLKIEANQGKGNYVCKTSSYFPITIPHVQKKSQNLSFSDSTVDWILSDTRKIGGVYYPQDVSGEMTTVTLISSNESVAEISSDNNILVKGIGTTTITALAVESDEYLAGSASYVLSIYPRYALKGVFSVSATKTVVFSKGNLQASVDATGAPAAWRVAEHQHDYLGEETLDLGLGTKELNLDLFCWSTDAASNNWGIHTKTGTPTDPNTPGFTDGNFRDWGSVIGDGWRTLSKEEWSYLLKRQVNGGSGYMYAYRNFNFTAIKIDGEYVKGIFFYPDNYTGSYNETTWAEINAANIVFLPGGGYREGQMVMTDYNRSGLYWTSTPDHDNRAYYMTFAGDIETGISDFNFRFMGYSVRLVADFK